MSFLWSFAVRQEGKVRVFVTRFLQDVLGAFYGSFRFSIATAVVRGGLSRVETAILGESRILMAVKLRSIVADVVIWDAVTGKFSLHKLYNGAGCDAP